MAIPGRHVRLVVAFVIPIALLGGTAVAQTQPFLFTVTTLPPTSPDERWVARYETGYGERTSEPFGFDGLSQRVNVQGALSHGFTVLGQVGLGFNNGAQSSTSSSQEIEVLKDLHRADHGLGIAMGLGLRHEWGGATVLLGRVSTGHRFAHSSLFGNVRFEKPFEEGRDAVDLISTLGWMHDIGRAWKLGVEAVGEDLEGFWEAEEAEGGAKLFVGPSLQVAPPHAHWSVSVVGGPIVYATHSAQTSPAARPLQATDNGYTVRASFGYSF